MDWTETKITGEEGEATGSLEPFREDDTQEVLRFLNRQIRSYDIYTVLNPDYLKQAAKEAKSQDGCTCSAFFRERTARRQIREEL